MEKTKKYNFLIPLTEEQKRKYDEKHKAEGKTSEGCLKVLVLDYIKGDANDKYSYC